MSKFETNSNGQISNDKNGLEYSGLGFRFCFGFRYSYFGFVRYSSLGFIPLVTTEDLRHLTQLGRDNGRVLHALRTDAS